MRNWMTNLVITFEVALSSLQTALYTLSPAHALSCVFQPFHNVS